MKQIWTIAQRELTAFFDSLMAYILLVLFLAICGFLTWLYGNDVFYTKEASLEGFFFWAYICLFVFIPAITMRLIAEENRSGTIELLLTRPVSTWQVVMGKFASTVLVVGIALALTLPYYITIANIGNIDHGAVWAGYFGLLLVSAAYISIGVFASTISDNQIVAFLLALTAGLILDVLFYFVTSFPGFIGSVAYYLKPYNHFEAISRGVLDSKDIIFFLSITFLGLAGADLALERRK